MASVIRRPRLLDDPRTIAQGELGVGPAFNGGREARPRQQVIHHASEVCSWRFDPVASSQRSMLWAWWGMSRYSVMIRLSEWHPIVAPYGRCWLHPSLFAFAR
jgi:hypothetical protein